MPPSHNVFLYGLILENGTAPGTSGLGENVLVESGSRATLSNVEFLGTLNVSGLTDSDFQGPAAGNWEAAVGGLLDGACPSGPAVDIVNQPRSLNTVERGAYEIDWQVPQEDPSP